jgi:hypothetical protein
MASKIKKLNFSGCKNLKAIYISEDAEIADNFVDLSETKITKRLSVHSFTGSDAPKNTIVAPDYLQIKLLKL